jgi:hypothetical protein
LDEVNNCVYVYHGGAGGDSKPVKATLAVLAKVSKWAAERSAGLPLGRHVRVRVDGALEVICPCHHQAFLIKEVQLSGLQVSGPPIGLTT